MNGVKSEKISAVGLTCCGYYFIADLQSTKHNFAADFSKKVIHQETKRINVQ